MFGQRNRVLKLTGALEKKDLTPDIWPADLLALPTLSGTKISPQTALAVPAVANAVALISGACGTLPLKLYKDEGGGKVPAIDHPAFDLVAFDANDWTSSSSMRAQLAQDALLYGDGFAAVTRLPDGTPFELIRMRPGSVIVYYDPSTNEPFYSWQPQAGSSTLDGRAQVSPMSSGEGAVEFSYKDVIHITSPLSINGITGIAPIQAAREAIGLCMVLEEYAGRLFGQGARPSGILSFDGKLDAATAGRIRDSWNSAHAGHKSGKTAILENGGKFQQMALASTDAQFLEMRHFQIVEIARAFGVSPVMIGDASRATWSNAEQYNLQFLQYSLLPWLRTFESGYRRVMLTPDERKTHSISFAVDDLLRGDTKSRAEFVSKMRAAGVMTANDARALENLPAHVDGDVLTNPFTATNEPRV